MVGPVLRARCPTSLQGRARLAPKPPRAQGPPSGVPVTAGRQPSSLGTADRRVLRVGAVLHGTGALTIDHLPPLHGHFRVLTITLLPPWPSRSSPSPRFPAWWSGPASAGPRSSPTAPPWPGRYCWRSRPTGSRRRSPTGRRSGGAARGGRRPAGLAGHLHPAATGRSHPRARPSAASRPRRVDLGEIGLPGPLWAALLVIVVGCSATVAIALTVRRLAGEQAARRALPYLALTPASVWIATSMDAFFMGVGAWGVALLVLGRGRFARILFWAAAGVLLGALPYLSYGLVPYLPIPVVVAVAVRPPLVAVLARAGRGGGGDDRVRRRGLPVARRGGRHPRAVGGRSRRRPPLSVLPGGQSGRTRPAHRARPPAVGLTRAGRAVSPRASPSWWPPPWWRCSPWTSAG